MRLKSSHKILNVLMFLSLADPSVPAAPSIPSPAAIPPQVGMPPNYFEGETPQNYYNQSEVQYATMSPMSNIYFACPLNSHVDVARYNGSVHIASASSASYGPNYALLILKIMHNR